jgi:Zn-dependent protease
MPFKCPYCGEYFCPSHRLPENHDCPEYWRVKAPRDQPAATSHILKSEPSYKYTVTVTPPGKGGRAIWFSPTELKHLAIGVVLTLAIGFSMPLYWFPRLYEHPDALTVLAATFSFSFMIHEIAHKVTAQRHGLWAEFRITMTGALITLISILSPIKIISPGAVMIGGHADKETIGKTSIAGPLTNITLALLFLTLTVTLFDSPIRDAFYLCLLINSIIAVFNLIPFGILDGFKVFGWSKIVWATTFSVSLALTIYSNFFLL